LNVLELKGSFIVLKNIKLNILIIFF